jgi:hypothetical protein
MRGARQVQRRTDAQHGRKQGSHHLAAFRVVLGSSGGHSSASFRRWLTDWPLNSAARGKPGLSFPRLFAA